MIIETDISEQYISFKDITRVYYRIEDACMVIIYRDYMTQNIGTSKENYINFIKKLELFQKIGF